ncbi:hypothetical protein Htur_2125 [Haloterrigena turkmenica DSM 5511]|uniref:MYXO-CTERM domain-containing protein n=1 Tax=Haloterrigena turkmenica (strain ATCC 51198 / DSM 5511 / JCM 9101 / NCIMB 13204 / VKM B-1734 / 4k) TaxID=543526 RepID=D2RTQ7_HALTV|nr:hypothetical protein [Haloterrigena turkmenica]ADB61008.1 hypothetical protein Htur_2125 [Haloterrigena turkmenica DSM 5511]
MAESEQQEKMLSETIVKEAVGLGMKSPLRDSIVEAVDEAGGSQSGGGSGLPLAGALFGAGAALGFLAGRQSPELEDTSLEDIEEPEIIEDVIETESDEDESITETTDETESEGGSSRLIQLLITVGAIAAVAVLRRRLSGGEEEEWEPIEEFEPATGDDIGGSDDEEEEEPVEAEAESEDADEEEE